MPSEPPFINFEDLNVEYKRKQIIDHVKKLMPSKEVILANFGFDVNSVYVTYGKEFRVWVPVVVAVILKEYGETRPYVLTRHYTKDMYTECSYIRNLPKCNCNYTCSPSVNPGNETVDSEIGKI